MLSIPMREIFWKSKIEFHNLLLGSLNGWLIYIKEFGLGIVLIYVLIAYIFWNRKNYFSRFLIIPTSIVFIVTLYFYSSFVYPNTNSVFGGGEKRSVDIYISDQYINTAESMGYIVSNTKDKHVIKNVRLIHETENNLYITPSPQFLIQRTDVICIYKKGVNGLFIH